MRLSDNYQYKSSIVTRGLTFFGSFVVAFVAAGLFSPLIVSNASDSSSSIAISIEPFIAVSQSSDTISLNTTPTATGTFSSGSNTYSISTNNSTGYTMSVTDLDTDTNLTNIANSEYNIPTLEETTGLSLDNFTINHWGLSSNYDSTNNTGTFYPIPASSGTAYVVSTDAPSEDNINLTLATKIDNTKSSGLYTDDIVVSVVTNTAPTYHKVFGGITTMQEMTSEICSAENTPSKEATNSSTDIYPNGLILTGDTNTVPQAILRDTRGDGQGHEQTYVVRKLANGDCWMSQNLNLFLTAGMSLSSEDTDLNSQTSWDPEITTSTNTIPSRSSSRAKSYSVGDQYCYGSEAGVSQTCTSDLTTIPDDVEIDGTNHIGNHYNWFAATAGTGNDSMSNYHASDSICPKGWMLPTYYSRNSFGSLFGSLSYNIPDDIYGVAKLREKPFSFVLARGASYTEPGEGEVGNYMTSDLFTTNPSSTSITQFVMNVNNGYSYGNANSKSYYYNVRCVAR